MRSSGMPWLTHSAAASSSAGTVSSPPKTAAQIRERSIPSSSENSSAQSMASFLK